jgi:hypothetical protein
MGRASALYAFILENFWTKVGLEVLFIIHSILENFAIFVEYPFLLLLLLLLLIIIIIIIIIIRVVVYPFLIFLLLIIVVVVAVVVVIVVVDLVDVVIKKHI